MSKLTEEQLEKLRAEHGALWTLEIDGNDVAFRKATRSEYRAFTGDLIADKKNKLDVLDQLARDVVVFPARADLNELLDEYPAASARIVGAVTEIAQGDEVTQAKKYKPASQKLVAP